LIGTTCVEINLGKIFFAKKQGFAVPNIVELLWIRFSVNYFC